MLNIIRKEVFGHQYKTINIDLNANTDTFPISTQYDLGLPDNAIVYGLAIRNDISGGSFTSENISLADISVFENALINLKSIDTKTILNNYPIGYSIKNNYVVYFEPRKSKQIDWERSTLFISPKATGNLQNNTQFELIVLYYFPIVDQEPGDALCFTSGRNFPAIRTKTIEVVLSTGRYQYPLSKQTDIGLDENDILIGFDNDITGNIALSTNVVPDVKSMYLTIQQKTRLIVDNLPISMKGYPKMDFETSYKPLSPCRVGSIDWFKSNIFIPTSGTITNNASVVLNLYYVRKEDLY